MTSMLSSHMHTQSLLRMLLVGLLALGACGDDSSGTGGGEDGGTDEDMEVDTGPMMSTFYGNCTEDSQCPGPDGFCNPSFPNGLCSRRCPLEPFPDATNCLLELPNGSSRFGRCLPFGDQGACFPTCVAAIDCGGPPVSCIRENPGSMAPGVCQVLCSSSADCGGNNCNPYTARCEETPTTGAEIGAACTDDSMCRSRDCSNTVLGQAAPGGYCLGTCVAPPNALGGGSFPQASCPAGAVCFPNSAEGGSGTCVAECDPAGMDCRDGYFCANRLNDGTTFSNGLCFPGMPAEG